LVHKAKWEYFRVSQELEKELLAMSARQMDRRLQSRKREQKRKIYGQTKPGAHLSTTSR
jgi:hypothetical protein